MKISFLKYGLTIDVRENDVIDIFIENKHCFSDIISSLVNDDDGISIYEGEKKYNISKVASFIDNPLVVDCNEKRILSALYKELEKTIQADVYEDFLSINLSIQKFIYEIINNSQYNLEISAVADPAAMLKYANVRVTTCYDSNVERLVEYMRALKSICAIDVFFILNLKDYIDEEECIELYKFCRYEKIILINIQGHVCDRTLDEKIILVDKDLCIIEI